MTVQELCGVLSQMDQTKEIRIDLTMFYSPDEIVSAFSINESIEIEGLKTEEQTIFICSSVSV